MRLVGVLAICAGCRQLLGIEDPTVVDAGAPASGARKLVFDNRASSTDLDGFPVLVRLDATRIDYALVSDPARDLRFDDADVTLETLPFEVDHWDPTGASAVWVRVPRIDAASSTDSITMTFGPGVASAPLPEAIWTGYDVVHHFGTSANSAGSAYGALPSTAVAGAGKVGPGVAFAGSGNQVVDFDSAGELFDGWPAFTLEWWMYPDYAGPSDLAGEPIVFDKGGSLTLGRLFVLGQFVQFQVDINFTGGTSTYLTTQVALRSWNHIVYASDGANVAVYRDGLLVMKQAIAGETLRSSTLPFHLGSAVLAMQGQIDELRVSRTGRGVDWILAQFRSTTDQLVTFTAP